MFTHTHTEYALRYTIQGHTPTQMIKGGGWTDRNDRRKQRIGPGGVSSMRLVQVQVPRVCRSPENRYEVMYEVENGLGRLQLIMAGDCTSFLAAQVQADMPDRRNVVGANSFDRAR